MQSKSRGAGAIYTDKPVFNRCSGNTDSFSMETAKVRQSFGLLDDFEAFDYLLAVLHNAIWRHHRLERIEL